MDYLCTVHVTFVFVLIILVTDALVAETKRTTGKHSTKREIHHTAIGKSAFKSRDIKEYSNSFLMNYTGEERHAKKLGEAYGYRYDRKIMKYLYRFTKESLPRRSINKAMNPFTTTQGRSKPIQLRYFVQEEYQKLTKYETMETEYNITDAWWSKQWHLHPNQTPSMYVHEAWMNGYTGNGVTLVFVDDGVDITHPDLVDNFDFSLSYNYVFETANGSHLDPEDGHGTMTSGIAMAVKNSDCIIGISHQARFTAVRLLDDSIDPTDAQVALTLAHGLGDVDISSNSWGYSGFGAKFFPHSPSVAAAIENGITEGRQGKGIIYVMAAGNDGQYGDDCNANGNVVSIYTIAVNALAANGSVASYGEKCTSLMISAYGGQMEGINNTGKITTTSRDRGCTDDFLGTSAAAPVVSGIIALALEANSNLTWRDVQHLIVETATNDGLPADSNFVINGAGRMVSEKVGFGLINAMGMIQAAKTWKTVPTQLRCVKEVSNICACGSGPLIEIIEVDDCFIRYLEHVEVYIYFKATWREFVELHLISPSGTDSKLLRQRHWDMTSSEVEHTFMTVHHWGEDPLGNWTLRMDEFYKCANEGTLGGYCDHETTCTNGTSCLQQHNVCVMCDLPGSQAFKDICRKMGEVDGYCDANVTCVDNAAVCNYDNNTCVLCEDGFRNIDGICIEDGQLGGFCDVSVIRCSEQGVGCYEYRCIQCTNGYHLNNGYCIEDGTLYGYCDEEQPCTVESSVACLLETNLCVNCQYWSSHSNLDGFCIKDGSHGGHCNIYITCAEDGNGCDMNTSRCVQCWDNRRVIDGYCWLDATLFGYCNTTMPCVDDSVCDPDISECVECDEADYRIFNGFCVKDGTLGGYCDEGIRCTQHNSACLQNETTCVYCTGQYAIENGFCVMEYDDDKSDVEEDTKQPFIVGAAAFVTTVSVCSVVMFIVFKKFLAQRLVSNVKGKSNECSKVIRVKQIDEEIGDVGFMKAGNSAISDKNGSKGGDLSIKCPK